MDSRETAANDALCGAMVRLPEPKRQEALMRLAELCGYQLVLEEAPEDCVAQEPEEASA